MKQSIQEIIRTGLLLAIVLELAYISWQLAPGTGAPEWPAVTQRVTEKGSVAGKIPKPPKNQTISEAIQYTRCAVETILRLQVAEPDSGKVMK